MTFQRRTVLQQAAIAAATLTFGRIAHAQVRRSNVYGRIGLELDGVFAGWVDSFQGGDLVAEVVVEAADGAGVHKKHVANVATNDIVLTVGNWMSSAFYQWIQDTLSRRVPRRNGAILMFDTQLRLIGRLEFRRATLKEVDFPALDAASTDAAHFTVRIAPEATRMVKGDGSTAPSLSSTGRLAWRASNYRIALDGVDTSSVSAIDGLAFGQSITTDVRGQLVEVDFQESDLLITQPGTGTLGPWIDDFLVQGNRLDANERSGSLTLLAPNLTDALFTLGFRHLGIVGRVPNDPAAQTGNPIFTRVQLYMEDMQFNFTPTWTA